MIIFAAYSPRPIVTTVSATVLMQRQGTRNGLEEFSEPVELLLQKNKEEKDGIFVITADNENSIRATKVILAVGIMMHILIFLDL